MSRTSNILFLQSINDKLAAVMDPTATGAPAPDTDFDPNRKIFGKGSVKDTFMPGPTGSTNERYTSGYKPQSTAGSTFSGIRGALSRLGDRIDNWAFNKVNATRRASVNTFGNPADSRPVESRQTVSATASGPTAVAKTSPAQLAPASKGNTFAAKGSSKLNTYGIPQRAAENSARLWDGGGPVTQGNYDMLHGLISQRDSLAKAGKRGSAEYNRVQNKINSAFGSKVQHPVNGQANSGGAGRGSIVDRYAQASKNAKNIISAGNDGTSGFRSLNDAVAFRNKAQKGSAEWSRAQNYINEAYGVSKRYQIPNPAQSMAAAGPELKKPNGATERRIQNRNNYGVYQGLRDGRNDVARNWADKWSRTPNASTTRGSSYLADKQQQFAQGPATGRLTPQQSSSNGRFSYSGNLQTQQDFQNAVAAYQKAGVSVPSHIARGARIPDSFRNQQQALSAAMSKANSGNSTVKKPANSDPEVHVSTVGDGKKALAFADEAEKMLRK